MGGGILVGTGKAPNPGGGGGGKGGGGWSSLGCFASGCSGCRTGTLPFFSWVVLPDEADRARLFSTGIWYTMDDSWPSGPLG